VLSAVVPVAAPVSAEGPEDEAPTELTPSDAGQPVPAVQEVEEAATPTPITLQGIKDAWAAVVEAVQDHSINLATAAKDATLQTLDAGTLTLQVVNGYQRKVLDDPGERLRLEQALSARFGSTLRVRVVFAQPAARVVRSGKPSAGEVEKLLNERPEMRRVQEMFGAEIVEIRHED